ncbi:MAG: UvrB/UvrC motif-containing protein [Patescibacteria group bacterium]|nr:UvrB/UvrC motif-containing protein [Patescibacteria group bacterium]
MEKSDVDFKKLPDAPGVYYFRKGSEILYVGKATSLRDRVKSYFSPDLSETRGALVVKVVADATRVTWDETGSVLEALILEAKRIKELKPVGNTMQKDDKSWNWLVVTKEKFPRFLVVRERSLKSEFSPGMVKYRFGPFTSGWSLKEALRLIRRIFPFFDTPFPLADALTKAQEKTVQFNQAIGHYPALDAKEYAKTVRSIVLLFSAKKKSLLRVLEREMKKAAKEERFEEAAMLRGQIFALEHIQDVTLIKDEFRSPLQSAEFRVEAYDTAHLRGESPRGVMVVIEGGEPQKSEYRTFTIREAKAGDDYVALAEIIERRAKHREWPYPQLVVIDGGRAHLNAAKKALAKAGMADAEVVSVVKDERHRPREILGSASVRTAHEDSILLANAEAHRYAIGRHRRALRKR